MYLNATLEKKQKKVAVSAVFEINLNKNTHTFTGIFIKRLLQNKRLQRNGSFKGVKI